MHSRCLGVLDAPGHIMMAQNKNAKTEACVKDYKTTQEEEHLGNLEILTLEGLLGGSDGKESTCNARDLGSISGLGRCLGEGNGYPLQHSCLENSMDRGAWWATIHEVTHNGNGF